MTTRVESILNPFQGVRADLAPLQQATLALGSLFREKLGLDGKGLQKLDMQISLSGQPKITLTSLAFVDGDWKVLGSQVIEQDGTWKATDASPDLDSPLQEISTALLDTASKVQKVADPIEEILATQTPIIVQKIRELKDKIAQLTIENTRLQRSAETSGHTIEEYQRALKDFQAKLLALKTEVTIFKQEYGEEGKIVSKFGGDIEQLRDANQALQDQMARYLRRIADLEEQNRVLQAQLDSLPPPVDTADALVQMQDRIRPIADRLAVLAKAGWDFDEKTYLYTAISNLSCLNANGFDERELTAQVQALYPAFITEPMADRRNVAAMPVKACLKHIHDYPQDVFEKDRKAFVTFAITISIKKMDRVGINRINAQTIERNDHFFQLGGEFTTAHLMTTFPNIAGNLMALENRLKETYRLYCELQGKSVDNDTEMDRIHLHIRRVHQLMTVVRAMKGSVKAILDHSKKR